MMRYVCPVVNPMIHVATVVGLGIIVGLILGGGMVGLAMLWSNRGDE